MSTIIEGIDAAPNASTSYAMSAGDDFYGTLDAKSSDWIAVTLTAGTTYSFGAVGLGSKGSGLTDPLLVLHDADGNLIALNDNGGPGKFATITTSVTTAGTYYVEVSSLTASGDYGLVMTEGEKPNFGVEMGAAILYRPSVTWADAPSSPATVTWGIRSEGLTTDASGNAAPFYQLTAAQIAVAKAALGNYSDIANISFVQLNPGGTSNDATILMGAYKSKHDGAGAFAYYPDKIAPNAHSGDLWLNDQYVDRSDLPIGSYSYFVFLHELGHAMGLAHPGDYNAAPGVRITFDNSAQFAQDSEQYTVMSYFHARATEPGAPKSYADTLMMYDIYAVQQIYGVNHNTRAGDDTYGFHATVGGAYDFTVNKDPLLCIWDGGGTDMLDLSGFKKDQRITLQDGVFSDVAGFKGNLSIAIGAVIENAAGGMGADDITGNAADNVLKGGKGADTFHATGGNDHFVGNAGADTFAFTAGFGTDQINDFNLSRDHLLLDASIWGGAAKTAAQVIADYATVIEGNLVLDFGLSEVVFKHIASADGLESQILFA
ncbi:MAG: M10 family metallopeptidase C-terminal domain-containing protein [bacterium]